ncbi:hypothetical protein [Acinetobacter sp. ABJ-A23_2]|uniref:hypothetical protein n=1 Tax=Acinetobacter sp. ABJ-A23_2 TaxID=3376991 RepID=UPI0037CC52D3
MSNKIQTPFPLFSDINGLPLDEGFIYIGETGKDPEVYPVPVFWDENLTIPAEQPVRTHNGYLSNYGVTGKLYISNDECSITVLNKNGTLIHADLYADLVITQRNLAEKLRKLTVNVESIAELLELDKWEGRTVYVKSYHSGLNKGGGNFIYASCHANVNDGGGCIKGWVRQLENNIVNPFMFGAYGLESKDAISNASSHDDSVALTNSIGYTITKKAILNGQGEIFGCHSVKLDSNLRFRDATLVCNKFDTDLISVLECTSYNDDPRWLENVYLENIHIDGKRELHTAIKSTTTQEDGGRSGFRFIRPVNGLTMINCTANNCAADGIVLFPHGNQSSINGTVRNVFLKNCVFNGNRRHGGSSNSVDGMELSNVTCNGNGLDIDPNAPLDSGLRGDQMQGQVYGSGWDSEEYATDVRSTNVRLLNCIMTGNARSGILFLTGSSSSLVNKAVIEIVGGSYDSGVGPSHDSYAILATPFTWNYSSTKLLSIHKVNLNGADIGGRGVDNFVVSNLINVGTARALELTTMYATGSFVATAEASSSVVNKTFTPNSNNFNYANNLMQINTSALAMELRGGISDQAGGMFKISATAGSERGSLSFKMNLNSGGTDLYFSHFGQDKLIFTDSIVRPVMNNGYSIGHVDFRYSDSHVTNAHMYPPATNTPIFGGEMVFELTSNTELKVKVMGSDGVVRATTLTLIDQKP